MSLNQAVQSAINAIKNNRDGYGAQALKDKLWPDKPGWLVEEWRPKARFPQLEDLITSLAPHKTVIAGGAVLGCYAAIRFNDIDVFPFSPEAIEPTRTALEILGYNEVYANENLMGYEHRSSVYKPLQVILAHTDAERPDEILRRFDLSIVQFGVYNTKLITNKVAKQDLKDRILRVTGSVSINSLFKRIEKYKERGFTIFDEEGLPLEQDSED